MLNNLRLRVGLLYTRFHFRRLKDPALRFTEAVSHAHRALVVLPESTRDIASVQWIVRNLSERFSSGSLTIVATNEQVQWMKGESRFQILTYTRSDISAWFVPRQGLLGKVKRGTFDIAFDLNTTFALPGAFLCRESKAPLRVSFNKDYADEFYNFQISIKSVNSLAVAYRNLVRCLEMF